MKIRLFLVSISIFITWLAFNKVLGLNFWADDWIFLYLTKFDLPQYIHMMYYGLHPGELFITIPWFYLFGTNHTLWNLMGLVLKISATFCVALAMYGLTSSKKTFAITTLLYASYTGGLNAFITLSNWTGAYSIILISLCVYFYTKSQQDAIRTKALYVSLCLFLIALVFDPMRVFFFPMLLLIWGLSINYATHKNILNQQTIITAGVGIFSVGYALYWFTHAVSPISARAEYLTSKISQWKTFFESLSLLLTSYNKHFSTYSVAALLLTILVSGVVLCTLRKKSGPLLLFISLFIPLFYFPNWAFAIGGLSDITHRYLALSGVGFVMLTAFFISIFPKKSVFTLTLLLVMVNIYIARSQFERTYPIRGYARTNSLFQKQLQDVPQGFTGGMFIIMSGAGYSSNISRAHGEGTIPFAISRSIPNRKLIPYMGVNYVDILQQVCPGPTKNAIPLSKIYAWYANNDITYTNITDKVRSQISHDADCLKEVSGY